MKTIPQLQFPAVLLLALLACGCARRTTSHGRAPAVAPRPAPSSAVTAVLRRQVINAADAGEGNAVVNQLRQQMAADPTDVALRLELAAHYGKNGQPELEMEHLRLAVERFPESRPAQLALAAVLRVAGQPRQAAESLERFLGAHPAADAEILNRLGICYDEAGEWKAGERAFRRALAVAPRLDYLHNNLGYNLLEQQRVAEAVVALQQALKWNPRSETARNNLGLALARSSGVAVGEALKHFENVVDAATANNNLAAALIEQQRYQESRRLLQAALEYNRSHAAALANLRLVSELDGKPATVPIRDRKSPWLRPVVFLKRLFVPKPAEPASEPAQASKGDLP